jgi:hypothetical protein
MRGSVTYEGRGQAHCEVRLCDLDAGEVVAVATTDAAGEFAFEGPSPSHVLVLARCVDEAIGVAGSEPAETEDIELRVESGGALYPVTVEAAANDELPASLDLTLDAVELTDAPELWLSALKIPFAGTMRAGFAARPLADRQTVPVQAGRWRIAAQRVVVVTARADGVEPEPSWFTEAATVDGHRVPAVDMAVEVVVAGPLHLVLHLQPNFSRG